MGSLLSRVYKTENTERRNGKNLNNSNHKPQGSKALNRKLTMDVTRHNFVAVVDQLERDVNECQMMSIDTELSGLRGDSSSLSLMDLQSDRYKKLKQSISDYRIIQFGLSCFKPIDGRSGDSNVKYSCNSYNFYIFPQKSSVAKSNGDKTFSVQSSSLTFLIHNGFDFNKLISDGISYLNSKEADICLQANQVKAHNSEDLNNSFNNSLSEEDKEFMTQIITQMDTFLSDQSLLTLDFPPYNGFKRKLIYETVKSQDYIDSIDVKTVAVSPGSPDRYISINKIDKEEKLRKQKENLIEAIGFSKVIQFIISSQKPIVGHNLLLDIMHTFNQFIEPLPEDYNEFKQSIRQLFPIIYDTKHIASSQMFKDLIENTGLGSLYETLMKTPFKPIEVNVMNGKTNEAKSLHEAGYDSYITGICFLKLVHHLGSVSKPKINHYEPLLMNDYKNKFYLIYTLDISYLDFENEEMLPKRDHVFHVRFPKEWKVNELQQLFSAFGGVTGVTWINDTSAFCALKQQDNSIKIRKSLIKQSSNTYKVTAYYDFVNKANDSKVEIRNRIRQESRTRATSQSHNEEKRKYKTPGKESHKNESKSDSSKLFDESQQWDN